MRIVILIYHVCCYFKHTRIHCAGLNLPTSSFFELKVLIFFYWSRIWLNIRMEMSNSLLFFFSRQLQNRGVRFDHRISIHFLLCNFIPITINRVRIPWSKCPHICLLRLSQYVALRMLTHGWDCCQMPWVYIVVVNAHSRIIPFVRLWNSSFVINIII